MAATDRIVPTQGPLDQSEQVDGGPDAHLPEPLPADPFPLFKAWFDDAHAREIQPNPNAMTLATCDGDGRVSARIVLCKGIDVATGRIVFYTNYHGFKGRAISSHPRVAVVFHWDRLERQVRIEGPVTKSPAAESDAYFRSRPWISRVGAWASDQSEPIAGRAAMKAKLEAAFRLFNLDPDAPPPPQAEVEIPRPPHWGGYRIWADRVELWVAGVGRLHDRASWSRKLVESEVDGVAGFAGAGAWTASRLQP